MTQEDFNLWILCISKPLILYYLFFMLAYYWIESDSKVKEIIPKPVLYFT